VQYSLEKIRHTIRQKIGSYRADETAPIIMHRMGGVRLGRTPLHNEKPKPLELAANRHSKHPSHPTCKPIRSVYQPVFLPTVAPPLGCAIFGAVSADCVEVRSVPNGHIRNSRKASLYRNLGVRASRPLATPTMRSLSPGGIRQARCGIFNGLCASSPITKGLCAENGRSRA
jgi:hypothetical protein